MNILTVDNISKAYGVRKIFDQTGFYLQEGDKAGIIGINGMGKTTLLRMIVGLEEPDEGQIIRANHAVISYLPQNPNFAPEMTVIEAVESGIHREDMDELSITAEAKSMLTKLGVMDFEQPCGELSGGQRKRLALVSVLLSTSDILVLDEPTNHLDTSMSEWLEEMLKKRKGAIVMVTHDRYFLDSVSNRIVEIDKGKIYNYATNYSGFLELKTSREEMVLASQRKRESILRVELEWVKRGARARSTKQKARLERYEEMKSIKAIEKDKTVELSSVASRLGRTTVELEGISKAYGEKKLVQDFSYVFLKNDRIGFVGENGCGKTTLMKIIMGMVEPDSGKLEIGQTVKMGYYAQEIGSDLMNPNQRVIDYIRDTAEVIDTPEGKITAARMLENFLFAGEDQYGPIGKLSGGEKRRLYLCKVLMEAPNVLILDEPTNDLDIATLQILETYLDEFPGIVIVVSHDRYFLDRVVRRIFAFEDGGKLRQYEGGYTDYVNRKLEEGVEGASLPGVNKASSKNDADDKSNKNNWKAEQKKKLKFTYQEQKDFESIEGEIASLEQKIEDLDKKMLENATNSKKLGELLDEKSQCEKLLDEKMERWMYLEDLAERIANGEEI